VPDHAPTTAPTDPDRYRRAVIPVSGELLKILLGLPPDVDVRHFFTSPDAYTLMAAITSPDLAEVEPGAAAPGVVPSYEVVDGRAVLVDTGIGSAPGATRWEWNYRYPDTGPTQFEPITEAQARRAAAKDLSVILLRRQPGTTDWEEAPA
jgi:hypothetical protein